MTKPSKFTKPQPLPQQEPTEDEIDRIIDKAESRDDPSMPEPEKEVRFTMALQSSMAFRVDKAREAAGGIARLAWIRLAIAEKLARDGH
jgi:hypothetical protein